MSEDRQQTRDVLTGNGFSFHESQSNTYLVSKPDVIRGAADELRRLGFVLTGGSYWHENEFRGEVLSLAGSFDHKRSQGVLSLMQGARQLVAIGLDPIEILKASDAGSEVE